MNDSNLRHRFAQGLHWPLSKRPSAALLRPMWHEHGLALSIYAILTIALSWPIARDFATKIIGVGSDPRHNLWQFWHVQQSLLGRQSLFDASLLYYPVGISDLVHGLGPVEGLLALPFWSWGPEAAYNGGVLIGFWLTGYGMYLLARNLKFSRSIALFAGMLLMMSEMHLAGLMGHMEKDFIGLLPLVLLSIRNALNLERRRLWCIVAAFMLLLVLLFSGWQFVLVLLAIIPFAVASWRDAGRDRRQLLRRGLLFSMSTVVLVGPLLMAIVIASNNPALQINVSPDSLTYQPDLIEFFLPSRYSLFFGDQTTQFLQSQGILWSIETTISLAYVAIVLSMIAMIKGGRTARRWALFTAMFMIFALGPTLKVAGQTEFTAYHLPLTLPYAWLTGLPGLGFMRTPGRFMVMGLVGFAILASFGLRWLTARWLRWRFGLIGLVLIGLCIENWPQPWPENDLPIVPQFYQQIAQDNEMYGVFDLPIKTRPDAWYIGYSSIYQMYQMVHHKGIAAGYISRTYVTHPTFPCFYADAPNPPDLLVNGQIADCYANAQYDLARNNFRYVVFHKPTPGAVYYFPGSWGDKTARDILKAIFGSQNPIVNDDLVKVYSVLPITNTSHLSLAMQFTSNWYGRDGEWRWATSPASLIIESPHAQTAQLKIELEDFYDPILADSQQHRGKLLIQIGETSSIALDVVAGQTLLVPIDLAAGAQTVQLKLEAGNYQPKGDDRQLSFAIHSIDLESSQ